MEEGEWRADIVDDKSEARLQLLWQLLSKQSENERKDSSMVIDTVAWDMVIIQVIDTLIGQNVLILSSDWSKCFKSLLIGH